MTRCTRFLAGVLSLLLIATPISAQRPAPLTAPDLQARRLRVRVVDTTGTAVQGATVYVLEWHIGAVSDAGTQGREAPTPAGLQAGLGFEVRLGRRATIAAEWRAMTVGATTLMPVTFGMRF